MSNMLSEFRDFESYVVFFTLELFEFKWNLHKMQGPFPYSKWHEWSESILDFLK